MRDGGGSECSAQRRLGPRIANVSAEQLLLPHSLRLRHVDLDPPRQRMQDTSRSKAASCLQVISGQASGLAVFMPRNSNIPNRREQECISKQRRRCDLLHLRDIVSTGPFPVSTRHKNIGRQTPPEMLHGPRQIRVRAQRLGAVLLKSTSGRTLNFSRLCRSQNKHEGTERNQRGLWVENTD